MTEEHYYSELSDTCFFLIVVYDFNNSNNISISLYFQKKKNNIIILSCSWIKLDIETSFDL